MFKRKLSVKTVLSAIMASFLFCLSLGKNTFAGTCTYATITTNDVLLEAELVSPLLREGPDCSIVVAAGCKAGDIIDLLFIIKNASDRLAFEDDMEELLSAIRKLKGKMFRLTADSEKQIESVYLDAGETVVLKLQGEVIA